MVWKIVVKQPDNWHNMREDGQDIEYRSKRDCEDFICCVKDCFKYELEIKEEENGYNRNNVK
jgi:hypothetical protein